MNRILILEDNPSTLEWLKEVTHESFPNASVDTAQTLESARNRVAEGFNLALIDLSLPDGSGIELVTELHEFHPDTYAVVTTIYDDDSHVFAAIKAGAKGYLLKDQPRELLTEQLRGIAWGNPPLSPSVSRRLLRYLSTGDPQSRHDGPRLTERELEVLSLMSRGFNRQDIGRALEITPNTAAGYIKTIYRKLNVSGKAEAIRQAMNLGLVENDNAQ